MGYTDEQQACIETHDRNLIVTAGAGSGKTHVLVERFMALLDTHREWALPSVVAITFTEKAAREMRERVRAALEDRIQAAAQAGDGEALERWITHQAALNGARIGTIHALCAQVLRANSAEAGLDPGFEVLDESEAAILLADTIDQALARLAREDHPAAALLVAYGVPAVRAVLREFARRGRVDAIWAALDRSPEELLRHWEERWENATQEIMAAAQSDNDLRWALDWIQPNDLPPGDKLADIWRIVHAQRDALLGGDPAAFSEAVRALAGGIKVNVGAAAAWGGKEQLDEVKEVLKAIRERAQSIQKDLLPRPGEVDEDAARWLVLWREAIDLAGRQYAGLKQDRAALDFDDLEALACDLLQRHEAVAARYRDEFRHVLVDEFQDTNAAQRDILYRLTGAGLPGGEGRLFVVGDPKQSIYAFRGADVSVFGAVRDDLVAHGGRELPLATSFRAHERLVRAFNHLFGRILRSGEGVTARYEVALDQPMLAHRPSEPERIPHHAQPLTVFAFQKPDEHTASRMSLDDMRRWEAWTLAQHIHSLVRAGTPVWDRALPQDDPAAVYVPDFAREAGRGAYRPLGYGDVAILFQAMTRVPLYEDVFKAAGLPYVTVAGRGYFDRQEVWDLLNLLRALHNPADDLALAAALRSPLFGLSDDALFALRLARGAGGDPLPLWEALLDPGAAPLFPTSDAEARAFAAAVLLELRDLAGRATIAEVLALALDATGTLAALTGLADGARRRGNVEKLLALARESGRIALGAFNAYARELTAQELREGEAAIEIAGAVTLISVHASKGLEFPVVVLADASWDHRAGRGIFTLDPDAGAACKLPDPDPDPDSDETLPQPFAWDWAAHLAGQRERAERRRLLYVGATRAQDMLILSGALSGRTGEHNWLRQWLAALDVDVAELTPSEAPAFLEYAWGTCAVHVPGVPTDPALFVPRTPEMAAGWENPHVRAGEPIAGVDPALPPLLAALAADALASTRILTATQIATLGHAPFYNPAARGRAAFRHSVLHDAPDPLRPLPDRRANERDFRGMVGEIVHRALRAWLLPAHTDPGLLAERLRTYAWERGLADPAQIEGAISEALDLLRRFEASEVPGRLERAREVHRELPFAFQWSGRAVHGVIDVLYFDRRGDWHVLDYKTAPVTAHRASDNARRYYLQIGVYARAVAAKTGQTPQTHLYYIHPGALLTISPERWGAALERLDEDLRAALG